MQSHNFKALTMHKVKTTTKFLCYHTNIPTVLHIIEMFIARRELSLPLLSFLALGILCFSYSPLRLML